MSEPTVQYKPRSDSDAEAGQVKVQSPSRNRIKTSVGETSERRPSRIPILFERAARSWWNPKFDSVILEEEFQIRSFPQVRRRFQYALAYIIFACILWCIFFALMQQQHWIPFVAGSGTLFLICVVILIFTFFAAYQRYQLQTSVLLSLALCSFCLMTFIYEDPDLSAVGTFTGTIEIIIMIYTVIPLPLFLSVTLGLLFSISLEVCSGVLTDLNNIHFIVGRALLHMCIHVIGVHVFIMAQVRKHSMFLKVCQSIITRRDLEVEKQLKQKMIHSLMPEQVAKSIIRARDEKEEGRRDEDDDVHGPQKRHSSTPHVERGMIKFRTFHMDTLDNVSILFADIVGFTKMSSNKTAEHLVYLLNNLFGRFDVLCQKCGCEKISTLGDCYYSVSGCPYPRPDHARCSVEMGLKMCIAIQDFDRDHNEEVNMRVGVHTGTVLCGLVGTRRFKFDVWSHDVTLANTMESDGKPGLVHISEPTYQFVKDEYIVDKGEPVEDIRKHKVLIEYYNKEKQGYDIKHITSEGTIATYFVTGRRDMAAIEGAKDGAEGKAAETDNKDDAEPGEGAADGLLDKTNNACGQPNQHAAENHKTSDAESHLLSEIIDRLVSKYPQNCADVDQSTLEISSSNICLKSNCDSRDAGLDVSSINGQTELSEVLSEPLLPSTDSDHFRSSLQFIDSKENADGVNTAKLLGQRDNLSQSAENVQQDQETKSDTALMEQIQAQREEREKTDKQLVACMQADTEVNEYLYQPPINKFTLNFLSSKYEKHYRQHIREKQDNVTSFAMPKFSTLCDMIVSIVFLGLIATCIFLGFPIRIEWLVFIGLACALELIMIMPFLCDVCVSCSPTNSLHKVGQFFSSWVPRHVFGAIIASLPVAAVYCNFSCQLFETVEHSDLFYCLMLVASLLHFCNFTMLSSWIKSSIATFMGIILLILLSIGVCTLDLANSVAPSDNMTSVTQSSLAYADAASGNISLLLPTDNSTSHIAIFSGEHRLKYEIILNMAILLMLIWFLNRDFEIAFRLSFHGDAQAVQDSIKMQEEKDQADWLLHNIIPEHVADVLKKTSKYCKNHKDVGVIFAKIVNYDDFYDESFEGGKEYLRVLNELMGDFEDLFDDVRFKDVEKIKTIGACLMAATGLNPQTRNQNRDPNAHLYALMQFSIEMLDKLEQFNAEIFNFDFELAIGFNYGEVTSGVIGTTKLLYDIWGDTVNIASRMYSTGKAGKVQVTEDTAKKLSEHFEFEYRGKTFVKGKGEMSTYLLVTEKPGAHWE